MVPAAVASTYPNRPTVGGRMPELLSNVASVTHALVGDRVILSDMSAYDAFDRVLTQSDALGRRMRHRIRRCGVPIARALQTITGGTAFTP